VRADTTVLASSSVFFLWPTQAPMYRKIIGRKAAKGLEWSKLALELGGD
jgi:hypothetical protein